MKKINYSRRKLWLEYSYLGSYCHDSGGFYLASPANADHGSVVAPPDLASYKELSTKWWRECVNLSADSVMTDRSGQPG